MSKKTSEKDLFEENNIKTDVRSTKAKQRQAHKDRNMHLAVMCAVFSIIVIIGTAFIVVHSISDKEKLRNQGIEAFNGGSYNEAIDLFTESISRQQWFSAKMDEDTKLYLAAAYMRNGEYLNAYNIYLELSSASRRKTGVSEDKLRDYMNLSKALSDIQSGTIDDSVIENVTKELQNGNDSAYLFLGICYQQQGQYDKMLDAFSKYTEKYGINTYVAYQLSSYYISKNDYDTAVTYINKGLSSGDQLYKDKLMYNDIILSEAKYDYATALDKASSLISEYPDNAAYQKEYDFLYSRINMDPEPVHTHTDADED